MQEKLNQEIYNQLKAIATKLMQCERNGHTLSPTDLVHEAFLKIGEVLPEANEHDYSLFILARQMRRLLVDYGRQKSALKRGGKQQRIMYTDALGIGQDSNPDFNLINDAIENLKLIDERAAQAIDLYYFTDINRKKAAALLNVSIPTLERDLRFAKANISQYLSQNS